MRSVTLSMRARDLAPLSSFACAAPKRSGFVKLAVLAILLLMICWLSGQPVLAQGLLGCTPHQRLGLSPDVVVESAKHNRLALFITVLFLLKVAIPICAQYDWWKNRWVFLSAFIPFCCGMVVLFISCFLFEGVPFTARSSGVMFAGAVMAGIIFGVVCLATAAFHHWLTSHNSSELTMKPRSKASSTVLPTG
jgi:hypothetical protein